MKRYVYEVSDIRVVDGDTIECTFDLGFRVKLRDFVRLLDVDTYELRSPSLEERNSAHIEKKELERILQKSGTVYCQTHKTGKYGRWLGQLTIDGPRQVDVNEHMRVFHAAIEKRAPSRL